MNCSHTALYFSFLVFPHADISRSQPFLIVLLQTELNSVISMSLLLTYSFDIEPEPQLLATVVEYMIENIVLNIGTRSWN